MLLVKRLTKVMKIIQIINNLRTCILMSGNSQKEYLENIYCVSNYIFSEKIWIFKKINYLT